MFINKYRGEMKVIIEPKKHRQQFPVFYEKMYER